MWGGGVDLGVVGGVGMVVHDGSPLGFSAPSSLTTSSPLPHTKQLSQEGTSATSTSLGIYPTSLIRQGSWLDQTVSIHAPSLPSKRASGSAASGMGMGRVRAWPRVWVWVWVQVWEQVRVRVQVQVWEQARVRVWVRERARAWALVAVQMPLLLVLTQRPVAPPPLSERRSRTLELPRASCRLVQLQSPWPPPQQRRDGRARLHAAPWMRRWKR